MEEKLATQKRTLKKIEILGIIIVALSAVLLIVKPEFIAGIFDAMVSRATPIVVKVFLTGSVGVCHYLQRHDRPNS